MPHACHGHIKAHKFITPPMSQSRPATHVTQITIRTEAPRRDHHSNSVTQSEERYPFCSLWRVGGLVYPDTERKDDVACTQSHHPQRLLSGGVGCRGAWGSQNFPLIANARNQYYDQRYLFTWLFVSKGLFGNFFPEDRLALTNACTLEHKTDTSELHDRKWSDHASAATVPEILASTR